MFQKIREALPGAAVYVCEQISGHQDRLYTSELVYIRNAVEKRRNEFTTGRICARKALAKLGVPTCPIPAGRMRDPVWPRGITGSITHDGAYAISAVAREADVGLLGIDLAEGKPLEQGLINMVCRQEDIDRIQTWGETAFPADPYKLVFSVKESLYKCLFPIVRKIFDFSDVAVAIDPRSQRVEIDLVDPALNSVCKVKLAGRFCVVGDYVFSAVWTDGNSFVSSAPDLPRCSDGPGACTESEGTRVKEGRTLIRRNDMPCSRR